MVFLRYAQIKHEAKCFKQLKKIAKVKKEFVFHVSTFYHLRVYRSYQFPRLCLRHQIHEQFFCFSLLRFFSSFIFWNIFFFHFSPVNTKKSIIILSIDHNCFSDFCLKYIVHCLATIIIIFVWISRKNKWRVSKWKIKIIKCITNDFL